MHETYIGTRLGSGWYDMYTGYAVTPNIPDKSKYSQKPRKYHSVSRGMFPTLTCLVEEGKGRVLSPTVFVHRTFTSDMWENLALFDTIWWGNTHFSVLKDCYGLSGDTAYSAAAPDVTMVANSDLFNWKLGTFLRLGTQPCGAQPVFALQSFYPLWIKLREGDSLGIFSLTTGSDCTWTEKKWPLTLCDFFLTIPSVFSSMMVSKIIQFFTKFQKKVSRKFSLKLFNL